MLRLSGAALAGTAGLGGSASAESSEDLDVVFRREDVRTTDKGQLFKLFKKAVTSDGRERLLEKFLFENNESKGTISLVDRAGPGEAFDQVGTYTHQDLVSYGGHAEKIGSCPGTFNDHYKGAVAIETGDTLNGIPHPF